MSDGFGLDEIAALRDERTRSITAENPDGTVGDGGQAASDLGAGRKGRPPRHGLYRWHLPDPIRFTEDLRVTVQVIGHDGDLFERSDDISSVACWYQTEPHDAFPKLPNRKKRRPR